MPDNKNSKTSFAAAKGKPVKHPIRQNAYSGKAPVRIIKKLLPYKKG